MIQYIIAAGIGAFLGSRSKKSKKSYAQGGLTDKNFMIQGYSITVERNYDDGGGSFESIDYDGYEEIDDNGDIVYDVKDVYKDALAEYNKISEKMSYEGRDVDYVELTALGTFRDTKEFGFTIMKSKGKRRFSGKRSSEFAKGGKVRSIKIDDNYVVKIKPRNDRENSVSLYRKEERYSSNRSGLAGFVASNKVSDKDIIEWGQRKVKDRKKPQTVESFYAKGGKTKVKYDYIPKEAIDELSYTMDKVSKRVSGSNVLSGAYVKSASKVKAKTKSASKVKAKTKGSSDLRAKILAMMTDGEGNKKVILSKDVKEMQKYVSDKLITAFYLGLPKAYDFKGDYSYSGGLVNYEEDYAKKIVVDALKNIKANKFEMGLKYPQYNFEKLLGKPIIKDIVGKFIKFSSSTRLYKYRLWIWKDCVIGQMIGMTDSKDGYSDYTYGGEPTLMGGYKSVQTSKASKLESIAKFMAKDKDGYLKDNDVLYNGLGGANFDALDKNKIKYEKGGKTRKKRKK